MALSLVLFSASYGASSKKVVQKRTVPINRVTRRPVQQKPPVVLPPKVEEPAPIQIPEPIQMVGSIPRPYIDWRIPVGDKRSDTFVQILALLESREVKTLVETGTSRNGDSNFVGDGGSTIIFGNWALYHGAHLTSVDLDPVALENASAACVPYAEAITFVCSDSISFLENFNNTIDFLYLDSFDYEIEDPLPSQEHHLREIIAAEPFLAPHSIVMIDDCDLPGGGKGRLVIEYLLERGWKIIAQGYQVILIQN